MERIDERADIGQLVTQINGAQWDEANDMVAYDESHLAHYVADPDAVFVACHHDDGTLMGIASSRFETKPYEGERWLYVDELDVAVDQRGRGAGSAMMRFLMDLARTAGCTEVWLGTEVDNAAANALYRSLGPSEIETFVGYAWRVDRP